MRRRPRRQPRRAPVVVPVVVDPRRRTGRRRRQRPRDPAAAAATPAARAPRRPVRDRPRSPTFIAPALVGRRPVHRRAGHAGPVHRPAAVPAATAVRRQRRRPTRTGPASRQRRAQSQRRHRRAGVARSRARSSTPRPATSGSRRTSRRTPADQHGRDSMPACSRRRPVDLLHPRPAETRGQFPSSGGRARTTRSTYPILTRVQADGTRPPSACSSGRYKAGGGSYRGSTGCASRSSSPDGKTVALVSDGPNPTPERRRPPALRHRKTSKLTRGAVAETRRSATRIRRGGRTARCCSTSGTAATAPRGARSICAVQPGPKRTSAADRARLHQPRVLARRQVRSPRPGRRASAPTS